MDQTVQLVGKLEGPDRRLLGRILVGRDGPGAGTVVIAAFRDGLHAPGAEQGFPGERTVLGDIQVRETDLVFLDEPAAEKPQPQQGEPGQPVLEHRMDKGSTVHHFRLPEDGPGGLRLLGVAVRELFVIEQQEVQILGAGQLEQLRGHTRLRLVVRIHEPDVFALRHLQSPVAGSAGIHVPGLVQQDEVGMAFRERRDPVVRVIGGTVVHADDLELVLGHSLGIKAPQRVGDETADIVAGKDIGYLDAHPNNLCLILTRIRLNNCPLLFFR